MTRNGGRKDRVIQDFTLRELLLNNKNDAMNERTKQKKKKKKKFGVVDS